MKKKEYQSPHRKDTDVLFAIISKRPYVSFRIEDVLIRMLCS